MLVLKTKAYRSFRAAGTFLVDQLSYVWPPSGASSSVAEHAPLMQSFVRSQKQLDEKVSVVYIERGAGQPKNNQI